MDKRKNCSPWTGLALGMFACFFCFLLGLTIGRQSHSDFAVYTSRTVPVLQEQAVSEEEEDRLAQSSVYPIPINTADSQQLQLLPNIGPARAEAIIAYRQEHGPFQSREDLLNVPGIGEGTLDGLEAYISFETKEEN